MNHTTTQNLRRILQFALPMGAAVVMACNPPPAPIVGPDSDSLRSRSAPAEPELPRNAQYADIASDPAHYFIVRDANRDISELIEMGHASEACCELLSTAEAGSVALGVVQGELYHGFSSLRPNADADAGSKRWLDGMVDSFRQATAPGGVCEGQVYFHELSHDALTARDKRIAADARDGQAIADALGRPMLIWNDNIEGAPHLLPVQRIRQDGKLEPLSFEFSLAELGVPKSQYEAPPELQAQVRAAMRVYDGIRALVGVFDELKAMLNQGRDLAVSEHMVTTRGDQARAHVAEIEGFNTCIGRLRGWTERLEQAMHKLKMEDDMLASGLRELSAMAQRNNRVIRTLSRMQPSDEATNPVTFCFEQPVTVTADTKQSLLSMEQLYKAATDLKQAIATMRSLTTAARTVNLGGAIDSGLRGINILHRDPADDRIFDAWMVKHQEEIWQKIRRQARKQGVDLGTAEDPSGVLHASNLLLRIESRGQRVKISPHFVISGPFYQVVDPAAKLVYYESAIAEHNLLP